MAHNELIRSLIFEVNKLVSEDRTHEKDLEFWYDSTAQVLIFIDSLLPRSETVNSWIPKSLGKVSANISIIELLFNLLGNLPEPNMPFKNRLWLDHIKEGALSDSDTTFDPSQYNVSIYELIFSRLASLFSQMLGDRFPYVQKILLKNLFTTNCPSRSMMASDLYVFLMRLLSRQQSAAMCQIVMNLCRAAPKDSLLNGAPLINRIKHPFVNFESPLYQDILTKFY